MRPTSVALALLLALAACSGPGDGFQEIGRGDTYGEWDAAWTGCMRVDHVIDGMEEDCAEPAEDLIVFEGESVQFGAVGDGETAVFGGARSRPLSELMGEDLDVGYRFFVVANNGDNPVELED